MNKIRKQYPDVSALFIPRSYDVKDISDFHEKYGHEETLNLIEEAKKKINGKESSKK